MASRTAALIAVIAAAALCPVAAKAHLMPEKRGTVHLVGTSAYTVVSIPVALFQSVPVKPDGSIAAIDLQRFQLILQQEFDRRFQVRDTELGGQSVATWVLMPQDSQDGRPVQSTTYAVVLNRVNFRGRPEHLRLFTDFFPSGSSDKMPTLKVSRDKEVQMLLLTPGVQHFELLPGKLRVLTNFVRTGIDHILTGPDHLLFLLTILVGAASWRYWVGAVSAFTVAHSITLTLSVLGYVHVPSKIVEPGIAASIVLMALDNLFRPNSGTRMRVMLIFLCGLLHGLGFAASIADMGLDLTHRILSLVGFNCGVEIGQFLFLGGLALAYFLLRRTVPGLPAKHAWPSYASAAACVLGFAMFAQRVM